MARRLASLFGWALLAALTGLLAGCGPPPRARAGAALADRLDASLAAATRYLIGRQAADGAWRSETYGAFKDGDALTPLVLDALLHVPSSAPRDAACHKGSAYLAAMVRPDRTIDPGPHGLTYPVYTAALAARVLSRPENERHRQARDAWLTYLRRRQLTEALGWQPADPEYGGWGYAKDLPRKAGPSVPVPPLTEPNLSATAFALDALRAAGCAADDPALAKARAFLRRCQNFADGQGPEVSAWDDGGFFFVLGDAVRNKAGVAGTDAAGRERYASYGSTTADGLRALLACGLRRGDPRVVAARQWLENHFRAGAHPGAYAADREAARPALYYYYCAAVARAFRAAGVRDLPAGSGRARWADRLAGALLRRQRPDGSWVNPAVQVREDDPLVATSLALVALAACRDDFRGGEPDPW